MRRKGTAAESVESIRVVKECVKVVSRYRSPRAY